jgi:hypothetical protein
MTKDLKFSGTIVRLEPSGFGIIHFDKPLGPSANTFGVISNSTSSVASFDELKPGVHVTGTADVDDRDLAAVTKILLP